MYWINWIRLLWPPPLIFFSGQDIMYCILVSVNVMVCVRSGFISRMNVIYGKFALSWNLGSGYAYLRELCCWMVWMHINGCSPNPYLHFCRIPVSFEFPKDGIGRERSLWVIRCRGCLHCQNFHSCIPWICSIENNPYHSAAKLVYCSLWGGFVYWKVICIPCKYLWWVTLIRYKLHMLFRLKFICGAYLCCCCGSGCL